MLTAHKTLSTIITAVVLLLATTPVSAQTVPSNAFGQPSDLGIHASKKGRCVSFNAPVAPAAGQPRSWKVAVFYCQPLAWAKGAHQVDVLTHGSTYTHAYWDWPQDPSTYSYVSKTLASGRAILNYDRIGNGQSSRPLSTEITMTSDAYVLHQLVQGLKLLGYQHINSISHSYGSGVALAEAAAYSDVNRIVLSGYLHRPSNPAVTAGNYPANQDPKFATASLDDGYLTTRPGVRGTGFHAPTSDPQVVAYDEAHKDIVSRTGLLDFLAQRGVPAATNISSLVHVPVLVVNGQQDAIFCYDAAAFNCANSALVTANETPFYGNATTFKVVTIPGSGHDLTLHPSASISYQAISQWLQAKP